MTHDPINNLEVPGVPFHHEKLRAYSDRWRGMDRRVYDPVDESQIRRIFAAAERAPPVHDQNGNAAPRRVTIRGGGHSFDAQALGSDVIMSMAKFAAIQLVPDATVPHARVGGGATWGAIVTTLEKAGFAPFGTVTSSYATAGGTLSSDCLSRFSARFGKEAESVTAFTIVTPRDTYECARPRSRDPHTWVLEDKLFMAAIGGFGYLGAIISITFNVRRLPYKRTRVQTKVCKGTGFDTLASNLVPQVHTIRRHAAGHSPAAPPATEPAAGQACQAEDVEAVWGAVYLTGTKQPNWILFTARFTPDKGKRLMINERRNPFRVAGEWPMRTKRGARLFNRYFYWTAREAHYYVDPLGDFLFFMDAHTRARHWARKSVRRRLPTIQQTFVVPLSLEPEDDADPSGVPTNPHTLECWLKYADGVFAGRGIVPTLQDVLYLHEDLAFCLSPNSQSDGFAVSYAFEISKGDEAKLANVESAFVECAETLYSIYHGRVSLVKNVNVNPATLVNMYEPGITEFLALKTQVDPSCLLRNAFLRRTFGAVLGRHYPDLSL